MNPFSTLLLTFFFIIVIGSTEVSENLIDKVNFIKDIIGNSFGNKIAKDDIRALDELYGSGDFNKSKTLIDADKHFASSVEGLVRLYAREEVIVNVLRKEAKKIDMKLAKLEEYMKGEVSQDIDKQNDNFLLIRNMSLPKVKDFVEGTLVGIFRIQMIYNVPFDNMIHGNISAHPTLPHFKSVHKMNSDDCLDIANLAKSKNNLEKTVEWLQVAEKLTTQENGNIDLVKSILDQETKLHDATALKHGKFVLKGEKEYVTTRIDLFNRNMAKKNKKKIEKFKRAWKDFVNKYPMYENSDDPESIFYEKLVHGEKIAYQCQNVPGSTFLHNEGRLRCEELDRSDPYLKLGPQKLERLSESPSVSIFHGFLSERQCDELIANGDGKMKSTPLSVPTGLKSSEFKAYTDKRLSKIHYISHRHNDLAKRMNNMLDTALGLDLSSHRVAAENYQLMNYGIGGYIEPHIDTDGGGGAAFEDYEKDPVSLKLGGERLMTFMVYLSSIAEGGGGNTVFPLLGLSVPPTKGTALFWNTIGSGGRMDERMMHLGCPVVAGNKWIVNKWVKWHEHMDNYPCYPDKRHYRVQG